MTTSEGRWLPFRHLLLLNYYLLLLYTGKITRLIVTMPPQHGKSELISKHFVCWWLSWRPNDQIAIVSYAGGVAKKFGRWCRDHFRKWGAALFGLQIDPANSSAGEWQLLGKRGGVRSVGVGGQLTSHPVDLGIIDDPIKGRAQAKSPTQREKQKEWFHNDFLSRLSKFARVIIVQTRWHEDDLSGHYQEICRQTGEKVTVLHLPAIAFSPDEIPEEEHAQYFPDPLGRKPGEALCPELHPVEQLEAQRAIMADGPDFWSIYQGLPRPGKGGVFSDKFWAYFGGGQFYLRWDPGKRHQFRLDASEPERFGAWYYMRPELRYDEVFMSVDCSFKDTSRSDYVAIGVYARKGPDLLKLDAIVQRLNLDDTCSAILRLRNEYPMCGPVLVEDQANGPEVIRRLRAVIPGLEPKSPQGKSKVERAEAVRYLVRGRNLLLPPSGNLGWLQGPVREAWVTKFKAEMERFPHGTHDDQVDETVQALKYHEDRLGGSIEQMKTLPRKNSVAHALTRRRRPA